MGFAAVSEFDCREKSENRTIFPVIFPVTREMGCRRPAWPDCVHHHLVRASGGGFRVLRIPRLYRGLQSRSAVCVEDFARNRALDGPKSPKVSARQIPFPKPGQITVGATRQDQVGRGSGIVNAGNPATIGGDLRLLVSSQPAASAQARSIAGTKSSAGPSDA
jgi:hypothetical protein